MNKNVISELSRTREIMGLKYKNYNLLTEQAKVVDDLIALFIRRKVSKEVAETMAKRVESLFAKAQRKNFGSVLDAIALPGNRTITKGGHSRIVSSGGHAYPTSAIDYIIHGVSTGKITSKGSTVPPITNLQTLVNKLPKFLVDGYPLRKVLLEEMQALEAQIIKDASEKGASKVKVDDVVDDVVDDIVPKKTKTDLDVTIPTGLKTEKWYESMWTFTKSIFYNPLTKSFGRTRQQAIRRFLKANGVDTPADLQKFLKTLKSEDPTKLVGRFTPEEITKFVVAAIQKGDPIPPAVVDDMMGIFLRSGKGFPPAKNSFSEYLTSVALRRAAKANGKSGLTEAQLRMLIGDVNYADNILIKLNNELISPTVGGFLRAIIPGKHWIPKSKLGKVLLWGSFTMMSIYSLILNMTIELMGTKKAIAGLTQQLYQKFSGQKEVIFDRGGLSDDEAKAIAKKLHGYLKSVSLVRDAAQLPEFEEKVKSYPHKDVEIKYGTENIGTEDEPKFEIISKRAESIEDIPNEYRKEFLTWFSGNTTTSADVLTWEAGKFVKTVSGVDDDNITDVVKMVPTVLAMSQVTWFYNQIDDGKLMKDLDLMVNILPYIGNAWNKYGKTKQDVFDLVEKKEWLIGSEAAGDDLADVITQLKAFWPIYPLQLKNEAGEWTYCRYKKGAYINTDNLNRIAEVYPWDPIGDVDNDFNPVDFQEFLNGLTAEEFNAGQCYKQGDGCPKPYFTPNKNHPDVNKKAGEKIETIVVAFENMVDEMFTAWEKGGWEGLQEYVKTLFKDDEDDVQEGLIRVLKQL